MTAFSALAAPNWPTNTPGLAALTLSIAVVVAPTRSCVASSSPLIENWTSTERPSLEIWPSLPFVYGDWTSVTPGLPDTAAIVSSTALRTAGSVAWPPLGAWTITCSSAFFGKWSSNSLAAWPDCPM